MQKDSQSFEHQNPSPKFSNLNFEGANCAQALAEHKEDVIRAFEIEARKRIPTAQHKPPSVLVDSLPIFLDQIISLLRLGTESGPADETQKVIENHGRQRATLTDFTFEQVQYEYVLLRRILFSILRNFTSITDEESDVIQEAIEEGMILAGSEFTRTHLQAQEMLEKEKRALQERADRNHASLKALLECSPVAIAFLDRNLRFIQVNQPLADLNGLPISAHMGQEVRTVLPKDAAFLEPILRQVIETGKPFLNIQFSTRNPKNPHQDTQILANYFPVQNESGDIIGLGAVVLDVTEIRKIEEALKDSYQTFKEMTDSLPVLFWWTDRGDQGNHFNKKYFEYTGLPEDGGSDVPENFHSVVHPDDLPVNLETREAALKNKTTARFFERLRRYDGEYRWHLVHATPVFYENGELKRWYATSTDVHEQKMAELEKAQVAESLKTETEHLSHKNIELDRFAAIAAHDLKSPLNSIIQFTQLLAEQYQGRLDEEADQYIDFIVNAGKRMTELIDNLLEFARAGVLDRSRMTAVSVKEVMSVVQSNLLSDIDSTQARITANPNLPEVHGKKIQIIQLFQNLIANAIKFHKPHQPPVVHVDFSDKGECWCFSIADQGIGMDPNHSQKIFEIFNRMPSRSHYEGSGIGLAVCKRIVEAHGGKIHFQSLPDQGATFYFTLPKVQKTIHH